MGKLLSTDRNYQEGCDFVIYWCRYFQILKNIVCVDFRREVSRLKYGCPRSCKAFFDRFGRVIGCGHVSGLSLRLDFDRRPVWSYADLGQITSASSKLTEPDAFPDPLSPIFVRTVR